MRGCLWSLHVWMSVKVLRDLAMPGAVVTLDEYLAFMAIDTIGASTPDSDIQIIRVLPSAHDGIVQLHVLGRERPEVT